MPAGRQRDAAVNAAELNDAAMIACTAEQRMILFLAYNEGETFRSIGRIIGRHHSTVIAQHDAALDAIREHLEGGDA